MHGVSAYTASRLAAASVRTATSAVRGLARSTASNTRRAYDDSWRVRTPMALWNYTLSMASVDDAFRTDWAAIGTVLFDAAASRIGSPLPAEYQGLNF